MRYKMAAFPCSHRVVCLYERKCPQSLLNLRMDLHLFIPRYSIFVHHQVTQMKYRVTQESLSHAPTSLVPSRQSQPAGSPFHCPSTLTPSGPRSLAMMPICGRRVPPHSSHRPTSSPLTRWFTITSCTFSRLPAFTPTRYSRPKQTRIPSPRLRATTSRAMPRRRRRSPERLLGACGDGVGSVRCYGRSGCACEFLLQLDLVGCAIPFPSPVNDPL